MLRTTAAVIALVAVLSPVAAFARPVNPRDYDQIDAYLPNKTVLSSDKRGTEVEYLKSGGRAYLLVAGSKTVIAGKWSIARGSNMAPVYICFNYADGGTYKTDGYMQMRSEVPGQSGNVSCAPGETYFAHISDVVDGDPLHLGKGGSTPFVLGKGKTTIAKLTAKVGH